MGAVGGPHTQHCGVSGVHLCAGQDFKCSPGTELVSPGLRYLKAVFHPDPAPRGLLVGNEGVLEADLSEGRTQMSEGCVYLFIYLSVCMCFGEGCWIILVEGNKLEWRAGQFTKGTDV